MALKTLVYPTQDCAQVTTAAAHALLPKYYVGTGFGDLPVVFSAGSTAFDGTSYYVALVANVWTTFGGSGSSEFETNFRTKQYGIVHAGQKDENGAGAGPTYACLSNVGHYYTFGGGANYVTQIDSTLGATVIRLNSAAAGDIYFQIYLNSGGTQLGRRDRHPYGRMRGIFDASMTGFRVYFGFFSADPRGSDTPPANSMGFRLSSGAGDANFMAFTKDATTLNIIDTGVVAAIATPYDFEVVTIANGDVEFYINDALVATSTANLPVSTTNMGSPVMYGRGVGAGWVILSVAEMETYAD